MRTLGPEERRFSSGLKIQANFLLLFGRVPCHINEESGVGAAEMLMHIFQKIFTVET